jgi:hypothetical protein
LPGLSLSRLLIKLFSFNLKGLADALNFLSCSHLNLY